MKSEFQINDAFIVKLLPHELELSVGNTTQ